MKTPEEQEPVWELLLKSKPQQPGPHFVRNVVREARKLGIPESGLTAVFTWFKRPIIAVPVAVGACAIMVSALAFIQALAPSPSAKTSTMTAANSQDPTSSTNAIPVIPVLEALHADVSGDLERIDYLSELVAITDPAELDVAALADLFY